jgi:aminoglycoside phosphotransferase (APT) family kinase protein
MLTPPKNKKMVLWLKERNPLGAFKTGNVEIFDVDPNNPSGHFNYRVITDTQEFLLRFKGTEWGDEKNGAKDEYEILEAITKYSVAPKPYFFTEDFFGEQMFLAEFLTGKPFTALPKKVQKERVPEVAQFIAEINTIPFPLEVLNTRERITTYLRHKEIWRWRIEEALTASHSFAIANEIQKLLPQGEAMLNAFENELGDALLANPDTFVCDSTHAGHLIVLDRDSSTRFLVWEQVSFGDPSFSLAVFLRHFAEADDFENIKRNAISAYKSRHNVAHFEKLLNARLIERDVSNLFWSLWHFSKQENKTLSGNPGFTAHIERIKNMLSIYSA